MLLKAWPRLTLEERQDRLQEYPVVCQLAGVKLDDPMAPYVPLEERPEHQMLAEKIREFWPHWMMDQRQYVWENLPTECAMAQVKLDDPILSQPEPIRIQRKPISDEERHKAHQQMLARMIQADWPRLDKSQRRGVMTGFPEAWRIAGVRMDAPYVKPDADPFDEDYFDED